MSIIVKSIEKVERKEPAKADDDGQATAKQAPRHKLRRDKAAPGIQWATDLATQLLGESATDPIFVSQFKRLKRAVIQSAFGELAELTANIVVITSALPNAGKTFVSMNMAQSLAQEPGRRVLLIDTDNIKATLTSALNLREITGFFDILDGKNISVDDIIIQTEVPNLAVIPTRSKCSDSAELLHSRRANEILNRLADEDTDRLIIFDAPPLLATSDASALADLAGQFLLVVEAGQTKRHELQQALEDISGMEVIGYRAMSFSINATNLWALEELEASGHRYSSSIYPVRHDIYGMPDAPRFAFFPATTEKLIEWPGPTLDIGGHRWACGGGGYFRILPYALLRWAVRRIHARDRQPSFFYFHPWEIDPLQSRVDGLGLTSRLRHYTNLRRTEGRLQRLLTDFRWDRFDALLGLRGA